MFSGLITSGDRALMAPLFTPIRYRLRRGFERAVSREQRSLVQYRCPDPVRLWWTGLQDRFGSPFHSHDNSHAGFGATILTLLLPYFREGRCSTPSSQLLLHQLNGLMQLPSFGYVSSHVRVLTIGYLSSIHEVIILR